MRVLGFAVAALRVSYALGIEGTSAIWGQLIENDADNANPDMNAIMSCFHGIGMKTCTYDESQSRYSKDEMDLTGDFPDFSWDSYFTGDALYCLECCSNRRLSYEVDEVIALKCDLSNPRLTYNGRSKSMEIIKNTDWEFRFAKRSFAADDTLTRCALQRIDPNKYVIGYDLTLHVEEHDEIVGFWRGVNECTAVAIETDDTTIVATNIFTEKIRLVVSASWKLSQHGLILSALFWWLAR
jgi:hypothetical protein